jgi:hypothetical protein
LGQTEAFEHEYTDITDLRNTISPKLSINESEFPRYQQVFEEKYGFQPDLSILDLIFNQGPACLDYIE